MCAFSATGNKEKRFCRDIAVEENPSVFRIYAPKAEKTKKQGKRTFVTCEKSEQTFF